MGKSKELTVALEAIEKSSEKLRMLFRKNAFVAQKYGFDIRQVISEADIQSEQILKTEFKKAFPKFGILSEEALPEQIQAKELWIIDPLCGSLFYSRGLTEWSVSVALMVDDIIHVAVISNPYYHETFWAEKNCGAFLNGEKIQVSKTSKLQDSIISIGHRDLRLTQYEPKAMKVLRNVKRLITMDNHWALTQVAAGRIDATFRAEQPSYEVAAGSLLVTEAGGKVTNFNGDDLLIRRDKQRSNHMLASNGAIHESLINILKG